MSLLRLWKRGYLTLTKPCSIRGIAVAVFFFNVAFPHACRARFSGWLMCFIPGADAVLVTVQVGGFFDNGTIRTGEKAIGAP